jgi:hypothetical protein
MAKGDRLKATGEGLKETGYEIYFFIAVIPHKK